MAVQFCHDQSLDRIESELNSVLEQDSRYWRENDAKFRAVQQNATYEQFEEIVKASHLKPLDKEDKTQLGKAKPTIWNSVASLDKTDKGKLESKEALSKSSTSEPQSVREFQLALNAIKSESRWSYLQSLGIDKLKNILVTEVPSELITDLIDICLKDGKPSDKAFVLKLLKVLAETKRFSLNIQFFSGSEKQAVSNLFQRLKEWSQDNPNDIISIENISRFYGCV